MALQTPWHWTTGPELRIHLLNFFKRIHYGHDYAVYSDEHIPLLNFEKIHALNIKEMAKCS